MVADRVLKPLPWTPFWTPLWIPLWTPLWTPLCRPLLEHPPVDPHVDPLWTPSGLPSGLPFGLVRNSSLLRFRVRGPSGAGGKGAAEGGEAIPVTFGGVHRGSIEGP